jgi:hypothetical protein
MSERPKSEPPKLSRRDCLHAAGLLATLGAIFGGAIYWHFRSRTYGLAGSASDNPAAETTTKLPPRRLSENTPGPKRRAAERRRA